MKRHLNVDWTIPEHRFPLKGDVVLDIEGNLSIVTYTTGEMPKRFLTTENIDSKVVYKDENPLNFTHVTKEQKQQFYKEYYSRKGWKPGRIYFPTGKDYPLELVALDFSTKSQHVIFIFRDMNVPEYKLFKTKTIENLEMVEETLYEALKVAFKFDPTSSLKYQIVDLQSDENGWTASGDELMFGEIEQLEDEILRWKNRMKVRRIASVLNNTPLIEETTIKMDLSGNLFVKYISEYSGEPAVFKNKVSAALAIKTLDKSTWNQVLVADNDTYII